MAAAALRAVRVCSAARGRAARRAPHVARVVAVRCCTAEAAVEAPPPPPPQEGAPLHQLLDIRVGRVLKAYEHPEADKLFVEEVDVGEEEPRTICSGLKGYVDLSTLEDRLVVVLANLKARNMVGIKSHGMLMAASDAEHTSVELLSPPEGAEVGERIKFGEWAEPQCEPFAENKLQKKKVFEKVAPDLVTTAERVAACGDLPMVTSAGPVTCATIASGVVS